MLKLRRTRILLIATLFVVGLVFGMAVQSPSNAAPTSNATYYNNAAHTTVVGQFGKDCCNNNVAWGVKTQYVVYGGCFVCFPPPR